MTTPAKRRRVPVHGVLLLDKPAGLSSTQALAKAKWLLNAEKAGHTGTLDPFATGLLPLCFGEATKFAQDLLEADKTYEATVHLGVTTSTGDIEGAVIDTRTVDVTRAQAEAVLDKFRGPISQVPPMHSALKRDGKPLYAYAREGITLERDARAIVIHELELLEFAPPTLRIRVRCSKGTYVRVLGEDIGKSLGVGAHLTALRRTAINELSVSEACTLDALMEAERAINHVLPVDALLAGMPEISLDESLAQRFLHGQRLPLAECSVSGIALAALVKLTHNGILLGTARVLDQRVLAPEKVVSVRSLAQIRDKLAQAFS